MDAKLQAVSALQGGVVLRPQVLAAGMSDIEIDRNLKTKRWVTVRRGAYAERKSWEAMTAEEQHVARAHAVAHKLRGTFAISHTSAAAMHGLPLWNVDLERVHVTRPRKVSSRKEAGVWHHSAELADDQVVHVDDLRVTSGARTVIDAARVTSFESGVVLADRALQQGIATPAALLATLDAMRDWPGARNAGRVVAFADGRSESVGESRARVAMDVGGLPAPALQVVLATMDRVDFLFEEHATVGEFDGKVKYGRLLGPDMDPGEAVWQEKKREDRIRELGYEVVRITWADLADPARIARKFRRAFARAARGRLARDRTMA